jgi:hypothetical protein
MSSSLRRNFSFAHDHAGAGSQHYELFIAAVAGEGKEREGDKAGKNELFTFH